MIHALALTGPTASGKTSLSIRLAKELGCEIICLDSMQIYKRMDIGTAKATDNERAAVKHHMLDFLSPDENFSAGAYKQMALPIAEDIEKRGKVPFFVGGTGLYLNTIMRPDTDLAPESDPEYRKKYEALADSEDGKIAIWERLRQIDPESAESIHYNNVRRVIRALEIYDLSGKTKTYFDSLTRLKSDVIEINHVTLDFHDRQNLYARVNSRVDDMMREGLLQEVTSLLKDGYLSAETTAAQAIGYKEMLDVISGKETVDSAVERLKQATRNYAKRQLTWFRADPCAKILFLDDEDGKIKAEGQIYEECLSLLSISV